MRTLLVRARLVWLQQVTRPLIYSRSRVREVEQPNGSPSTWVVQTGPFPWSITHTDDLDHAMGLRAPALRELSRLARVERSLIEQLPGRSTW
jgi:hypothetical protein